MPLYRAELLAKKPLWHGALIHDVSQVLYLPFDWDDGSYARDRSGYNNHGTVYGATRVAGKIGMALSHDGVDDYVKAGEGAFLYGQDEVMVATWIYIPSEQPVETWRKTHLYGRWVPGIFWRCLSIGGDYSKTQTKFIIVAYFVNEETGEVRDFAYNCYLLDQWVHVAWGYSKLVEKGLIYVNGDLVVERDITGWHADGFLGVLDDNLIDGFWIGSSTGGGENYKIISDETRIYSRILSATEIRMLMYRRLV